MSTAYEVSVIVDQVSYIGTVTTWGKGREREWEVTNVFEENYHEIKVVCHDPSKDVVSALKEAAQELHAEAAMENHYGF